MTTTGLTVYGGWQANGVADFSPFCLKVKTYLRMIGVPYTAKLGDPRTGPTKKIPFIDDDGVRLGDSGLIFAHLKRKHGDALDASLSADQRAVGHLTQRTLEESLYWSVVYTRWMVDDAWRELEKKLLPLLPPVIGSLIANGPIRGGMRKGLYAQGTGRHTPAEIHASGCADVDAVSATLGTKPFLLGDTPSSYDAILHGFIANVLVFPTASAICVRANGHANLVEYVARMDARYWVKPD